MKEFFTNLYVRARVSKVKAVIGIKNKIDCLTNEQKGIYKKCFSFMSCVSVLMMMLSIFSSGFMAYSVDADGVIEGYKNIFNTIYTIIMPFATILAVVLVGYNLCVIMSSKNQKKCDTAYTWIKAVVITWLCLLCISVFINLATQLFTDSRDGEGTANGPLFNH